MSTEIIPTQTNVEISVPKVFVGEFTNILNETQIRLAQSISEKYNLDFDDIISKCVPLVPQIKASLPKAVKAAKASKATQEATPKTTKAVKVLLNKDNWETASSLDELNSFTTADLKDILKTKSLSTTGTKNILVGKLWNILHPDQLVSIEKVVKKTTPPKATIQLIVDSDDELDVKEKETLEQVLTTQKTIYFNKAGNLVKTATTDGSVRLLIPTKNWVFNDDAEGMEFVGILKGKRILEVEAPKELVDMLPTE
jgi:hypothetical protein